MCLENRVFMNFFTPDKCSIAWQFTMRRDMWMSRQNSSPRAHTLTLNESPLRPPTRLKREDRNEGRYVGCTTGALALALLLQPTWVWPFKGAKQVGEREWVWHCFAFLYLPLPKRRLIMEGGKEFCPGHSGISLCIVTLNKVIQPGRRLSYGVPICYCRHYF